MGDHPAVGGQADDEPRGGTMLVRQFGLLSFLVVGSITAALCALISYQLKADLLEREWTTTADFIRTEGLQILTPADFADPRSAVAVERFRRFYEHALMMPQVVRVKIYDADMTVVWSDEARLIGLRFAHNAQLAGAVAGRTTVNLQAGEGKEENLFERGGARLVEVYVPIVFGGRRVTGIVETYKDTGPVFAKIRRGQAIVLATALAGGALLYGSLFWIVRRAARRIAAQHRALERESRKVAAANDELRAIQAQLIAAERMAAIGEVVASVAHGIRNPLANIRASAQVALLDYRDGGPNSAGARSLTDILSEVDRLAGRVKELLAFARPTERGSQPLDLNTALRGAVQLLSGRIREGRIHLEQRLAAALPVMDGDPLLLEQVFVNLIGNAVEALPEGGTVTLVTGVDGGDGRSVFAEVQDDGVGVPPEEIPKIFDLFYTTKAQGTGLGLAVAKKFVEAHGGAIAVRSRSGAGTTFRVTFPVGQGS